VPIIAVIVLVIILLRAGQQGSSPPPLRTSCTTPAFALSSYDVSGHTTVRWAVTGPARSSFVLAIGARALRPGPGGRGVDPVPDRGVTASEVRTTGLQRLGAGCTANGTFGVALPPGHYAVRLFRVAGAGTPGTTSAVAAGKTLTVTS
jgi:hypothetical protein